MFDFINIVVSKDDVLLGNIEPVLDTLNKLIESPEIAILYKERVDISFDGYNDSEEEIFEISEVRDFVYKLDNKFPYWIYFLSKECPGLKALLLCFLPPYLTEKGKEEIFPDRINSILLNNWFPALNYIGEFVGMSENENVDLTEKALAYICGQ